MKKAIIAIVLAVTATVVSAEWEKFGVIQIADSSRLSAAVIKLAEYSGNQMLGMMLSGAVQNPFVEELGQAREGEDVNIILFKDDEKLSKVSADDVEDAFSSVEYAVLYPIAATKEQFLAGHPGGEFVKGLYRVKIEDDDEDDDDDDDDDAKKVSACKRERRDYDYFAFSADGKYVGYSDVAEQAKKAVEQAGKTRPLKDRLVKVVIGENGFKAFRELLLPKLPEEIKSAYQEYLIVDSFAVSVGLYDGGLEAAAIGKINGEAKFADFGKIPLKSKLLEGVPAEAIVAGDTAPKGDLSSTSAAEIYNRIVPVLKEHNIAIDYLKLTQQGGVDNLSLDLAAMLKYMQENEKVLEKLQGDKLRKDLQKVMSEEGAAKLKLNERRKVEAFSLVGYKPKYTAAQHFHRTMRGVDLTKVFSVGVYSFSGTLNAFFATVGETMQAKMTENDRRQYEMVKKALPSECEGALAGAFSRDGDQLKARFRMDADEFKLFGAIAGAVMGSLMMQ